MKRVRVDDFAQRWRAARACARCHRLKSKCIYEDPAHDACRRCFALDIPCSVEKDPTAGTAKRRPAMKLPSRAPSQILQKIQRLLADAEREFNRMPVGPVERVGESGRTGELVVGDYQSPGVKLSESAADEPQNVPEQTPAVLWGRRGQALVGPEREGLLKEKSLGSEEAQQAPHVTHESSQPRTRNPRKKAAIVSRPEGPSEMLDATSLRALSAQALRLQHRIDSFLGELEHAKASDSTLSGPHPNYSESLGHSREPRPSGAEASESDSQYFSSKNNVALHESASDVLFSLISETEASTRYTYFHDRMAIYFPVLAFPAHLRGFSRAMTASPLLVLACIYATTICNHNFSGQDENRRLGARVLAYLDSALAQTIFIQAADLSYHIVFACMILSLWGVPPLRVHQYKSHIDLITAYSVAVCIDAGNVSLSNPAVALTDDSVERNNLRSFLAVYCSCGSLNFSLPRFNFATWSPRHNLATEILLKPLATLLPSQGDKFLCFYSRVVRVGKQLSDFLSESGISMNLLTSEEERNGIAGIGSKSLIHSMRLQKLVADLSVYEAKLTETVNESGLLSDKDLASIAPGERFSLLLTYYHLIMMIHDNLVSWCIFHLTADSQIRPQDKTFPREDKNLIMDHMRKFGEVCERILDYFIELNTGGISEYPTFFYYRALTALISLIRLLILVKSDILLAFFPEMYNVRFRLPSLYAEVLKIVESSKINYDLQVCERFFSLLERIGRWVPAVTSQLELPTNQNGDIDYLKLTDISKGQEVEKFAAQQMLGSYDSKSPMAISSLNNDSAEEDTEVIHESITGSPLKASFSIKEMFKGIDEDIIRYLNPFDTLDAGYSFTFD